MNAPIPSASLSREVRLAEQVVLVDGITRTGKGMMGPILSTLERVEVERMEECFEHYSGLYQLGKLARDATVTLLRLRADTFLYNSMIGRNSNFRRTDHSSIWRSSKAVQYIRRACGPEGLVIGDLIRSSKPIFQNQTHDQLSNFDLYHDAFGDGLCFIEMVRHPADLVESWLRRGWGRRFGQDPLVFTFTMRFREQDLPYYAMGWEQIYLDATDAGRVVRMIADVWDRNRAAWAKLTQAQRRQIVFIVYEQFIGNPHPYVDALCRLIGTRTTKDTARTLRRERCPRPFDISGCEARRSGYASRLSRDETAILDRLVEEYNAVAADAARAVGIRA